MLAARSPITVKTALRVAGFITLSLMVAGVSLGQIKSGVIVGTVLDSGGAAVPGCTVTVINPETNVTPTAVTPAS